MDNEKYRPPCISESPWLFSTHENRNKTLEKQTFVKFSSSSTPKNKSYMKTIAELNDMSILASTLGWLILRERYNPSKYTLWNPVTFQSLRLPMLVDAPDDEKPTCAFTSAPKNGDASCVLCLFFEGFVLSCRPATGDKCKWVKQKFEHNGKKGFKIITATVNGDIYSLTQSYKLDNHKYCDMLGRIKVVDDDSISLLYEPCLIQGPESNIKFGAYPIRHNGLVEVSGVLYLVYFIIRQHDELNNYDIYKVFVWRLDLSQMEWIIVESLGDRALLIGPYGSTWCWANASISDSEALIEGDCVYLSSYRNQTLHSYRLWDNSYTFFLPHSNFRWCFDGPIWFMPQDHARSFVIREERIDIGVNMRHVDYVEEKLEMGISTDVLSRLPCDMLSSIANSLHLVDYLNLRATCNTLHSTIPLTKWRPKSTMPFFMSLKDNKVICELWDPTETIARSINKSYSPYYLSIIEFSKDGWLLLRMDGDKLIYFNHFTREIGEYPSSDIMMPNSSYAFSTTPNSPDCITVAIYGYNNLIISCFEPGSQEWDYYMYYDTDFQPSFISCPLFYDEAFYFIGVKGNLGVFTITEEECFWDVYPGPLSEKACKVLHSCFLLQFDGQLICVFFQQLGRKVQVFRFNIMDNSWTELYNLGDHVLFLSPASSFSTIENDATKTNRIYLHKRMGNKIVYYSLDTHLYHILGGDGSIADFYGMKTQPFCCWM